MNRFRIRFGIMQCILALLLLLDAPNPNFDLRSLAPATVEDSSRSVVLAAAPPEAVYKHETGNSAGVVKRNEDHGSKAVATTTSEAVEPYRLFLSRAPAPPPLYVRRHRVLAAPPTGPPST